MTDPSLAEIAALAEKCEALIKDRPVVPVVDPIDDEADEGWLQCELFPAED